MVNLLITATIGIASYLDFTSPPDSDCVPPLATALFFDGVHNDVVVANLSPDTGVFGVWYINYIDPSGKKVDARYLMPTLKPGGSTMLFQMPVGSEVTTLALQKCLTIMYPTGINQEKQDFGECPINEH
jgi:hypothetical protein